MHKGGLYRFDGWTKVSDAVGISSIGQAGWTKATYAANGAVLGKKSLWLFRYPPRSE